ncbi:MAG: ABC transporter permease, partial [Trebonia sp.]
RLFGPSLIVDLRNDDAVMPDRVYVKTDSRASQAAVLAAVRSQHARAVPVSGWSAAVSSRQADQNQVGMELLLGIAIAYSAIGIAGTSLMSVRGRRSELVLLHTAGATRRQIAWIVAAESLVLTLTGIVLSVVVSGLVLGGLYAALAGEIDSPSVVLPWPLVGATLVGCMVIAILTSALPAWLQFRPRRRAYGTSP